MDRYIWSSLGEIGLKNRWTKHFGAQQRAGIPRGNLGNFFNPKRGLRGPSKTRGSSRAAGAEQPPPGAPDLLVWDPPGPRSKRGLFPPSPPPVWGPF